MQYFSEEMLEKQKYLQELIPSPDYREISGDWGKQWLLDQIRDSKIFHPFSSCPIREGFRSKEEITIDFVRRFSHYKKNICPFKKGSLIYVLGGPSGGHICQLLSDPLEVIEAAYYASRCSLSFEDRQACKGGRGCTEVLTIEPFLKDYNDITYYQSPSVK